MPRKLDEYERKREFEKTPEPRGRKKRAKAGGRRFVIQEHHASSLHWDLRLEHEGVALSWALPRGIPMHPDRNRLAVPTEDHPLEYLEFEGEIPEGSYGAGTMEIWDRGSYEPEKLRDDEAIVVLHGERIEGRYALFSTGEKRWMIHRMDPPPEGWEPAPEELTPMLSRSQKEPPRGKGWAYELKWDGVRVIARVEGGAVEAWARSGRSVTDRYPELRALGGALGMRDALLDGEMVAFDDSGRPSFELLQRRMHLASEAAVRRAREQVPATFVVFDLLHIEGRSLLRAPWSERRSELESLGLQGPGVMVPDVAREGGEELLAAAREQGLEGLVAKKTDSPYEPGRRSPCWVKVKVRPTESVVVGGWTTGEGGRSGTLGALLVGRWDVTPEAAETRGEPQKLMYAGKVGSGFTQTTLERTLKLLEPLQEDSSPFAGKVPKGAHFVRPELVAEVEFAEWTRSGTLRAPVFKGIRDDLDPSRIVIQEDQDTDAAPAGGRGHGGGKEESTEVEVEDKRLRLSNLSKVLYPDAGFTKAHVLDYYASVAPALLPHLAGRPLTMKRYPDGVQSQFFYEKRAPSHRPEWVATAPFGEEQIDYVVVEDLPTLMWVANMASLELHPSLSRASHPDTPTMVALDLDPGEPAGLLECCEVAVLARDAMSGIGLESFPKTSGSKGLQVYVPLNPGPGYEVTKAFARTLAELLERERPKLVVSRMTKSLRRGRVFIDWSQNDRHKTTVSVYSLRARERPTVSTPLRWEEVEEALEAGDASRLIFEAEDVAARVAEHGDLFAPVLELSQELPG